jgi:hypothetical protein
MFPPQSLGLVLAACVYAAAARRSLSNLYDDCEFTVDRRRYDLCPLFYDRGQDGVVKVRTDLSPTTQPSYEMSFGGPLNPHNGEKAEPQVRTAGRCSGSEGKWSDSCFSALQARGFV